MNSCLPMLWFALAHPPMEQPPQTTGIYGAWQVVSFRSGHRQSLPSTSKKMTLQFTKAKKVIYRLGRQVTHKENFRLASSHPLLTIDLATNDGFHRNEVFKGIYKIEGDMLAIAFADIGRRRPTDFILKGRKIVVILKRR